MAQHECVALGTSDHAFLHAGAEDAPWTTGVLELRRYVDHQEGNVKGKLDTHVHVAPLRSLFLIAGPGIHHCTATCHSVHLLRTELLQAVDSLDNIQPAATQSTAEPFSDPPPTHTQLWNTSLVGPCLCAKEPRQDRTQSSNIPYIIHLTQN